MDMQLPIAVVGTACRFPGDATSPSKLWNMMKRPRDVLREFPSERLNLYNFHNKKGEHHGSTDVFRKSYLLDQNIELFDNAFFRISPKEAAGLDPQQRILLETVYEAFESAGWTLNQIKGSKTSVHVGVMTNDYEIIQARDPATLGSHAATGLSRAILSNRISYVFDLKGPSVTIDTACSSSLVGLHLAVQGLLSGEVTQALVAGTNLLLDPHWYIMESSLHMLSKESRSRMWDHKANGYARGEGSAAVLLKTLSRAINDGDHIEYIIRGTGVNSDGGSTKGVTMPSPEAQADLIRETYRRAGLDPIKDRCQYFECHGTGTQAGDPVEARAIHDVFVPAESSFENSQKDAQEPLYCGSIKTIIGHLEGCAGLAGLIRASLAIQHKIIPPNMHFEQLNPEIQPYYGRLKITNTALPWPDTGDAPRRASVNSFGFGGTNAHVVIESYDPTLSSSDTVVPPRAIGPFVVSAKSQPALIGSIKRLMEYVDSNPELDLDTLAYVLQSKRTAFPWRVSFPSMTDKQTLIQVLSEQHKRASSGEELASRALNDGEEVIKPEVLGIFTGQGALAAEMGRSLLLHCQPFRDSLMKCEDALRHIPEAPDWSLLQELTAEKSSTRVYEALISQPLCTAIQIALVDLLQNLGIHFSTVIGHSSGEIGAAYAAGVLRRQDAIAIAYYRGLTAHLAVGDDGRPGAMLAATMSIDEAESLCSEFSSRVCIAASNAPRSVTLSGDSDAIDTMLDHLQERNIQARKLQVDKAYHSHHMLRASDAYFAHLKSLRIQIQEPPANNRCVWWSSVHPGKNILEDLASYQLEAQYWVDNMVERVLFQQALNYSVRNGRDKFNCILEVGPHPALKGPVTQTFKGIDNNLSSMPYMSCLKRDEDAVETFSAMLGTIWSYYGLSNTQFGNWRQAFGLPQKRGMLKDFPNYAWDHEQRHWRESRISHNYRLSTQTPNHLLGRLYQDARLEKSWRNIFHLEEMPWVEGHMFQNQVLFPGAGYVSMAVEAAKQFVSGHNIELVELKDMNISKAITITERNSIELIFTMRSQALPGNVSSGAILETNFTAYTSSDQRNLDVTCQGIAIIHLRTEPRGCLLSNKRSQAELSPLSSDRFHRAVGEIGLRYEGIFRCLNGIERSWGQARASASWNKEELDIGCTLHPAVIDTAFQTGLATFLSNAEKSIGSAYLPVQIKRVFIDVNCEYSNVKDEININVEAAMVEMDKRNVKVDIGVYQKESNTRSEACGIQIEGLILKKIAEPHPSEDRNVFVKQLWESDIAWSIAPDLVSAPSAGTACTEMADTYERITLYYLKHLLENISSESIKHALWYHQELYRYANEVVDMVKAGQHYTLHRKWLADDNDTIRNVLSECGDDIEAIALTRVGENMLSVVQGETQMIEHLMRDNILRRLYTESKSLAFCNEAAATMMRQISHKFPRTNILEVGAGTGGTTLSILREIKDTFASYTCTDISSSFFDGLSQLIPDSARRKVSYGVFDVEKSPVSQGFLGETYDVVIAANVLHATRELSNTIKNVRALLRPGGYMLVVETTGSTIRSTGLMGTLEGWWLGVEEGRRAGPGIGPKAWDDILRTNGFSGIDRICYDHPEFTRHMCSVFITQAMNDQIAILRDPISSMNVALTSPVLIIGGKTLAVSQLVRRIKHSIRTLSGNIRIYESFDQLVEGDIPPRSFVFFLSELDEAFFSTVPTPARVESLRSILSTAEKILWVTCGRMLDDPYSNMLVGVGRALLIELPHVTIRYLDFDSADSWNVETIITRGLQMAMHSGDHPNTLWVEEAELIVKEGQVLVSRIVQDHAANERLNASRRAITKRVDVNEALILEKHELTGTPAIAHQTYEAINSTDEDCVTVNIQYSVALHEGSEQSLFFCFGHIKESDLSSKCQIQPVFLMSELVSSTLVVIKSQTIDASCYVQQPLEAKDFLEIGSQVYAQYIAQIIPTDGIALLYVDAPHLAATITKEAKEIKRKVLLISTSNISHVHEEASGYIHASPYATTKELRSILPSDVSVIINLSSSTDISHVTAAAKGCQLMNTINPLNILQSQETTVSSSAKIKRALETITKNKMRMPLPEVAVCNIEDAPRNLSQWTKRLSVVIDWRRHGHVDAVVKAIDPNHLLSPRKTYFLVGMTGELGQSLCRFMLGHGVKYIVMASRNPSVDPYWVKELRSSFRADIRIIKMDVTSQEEVQDAVALLRKTMPEIGGVINAALVLEAGIFANFSSESIIRQAKPKVDGTINLDRQFAHENLDFFIAFGSLATVCGNPGQAMYHAGNLFMATIVEQRRKRGLSASILNFGVLVDVGYVVQMDRADETSNVEGILRDLLLTPLAEAEFHHVVLQGIISGNPNSATGEVIMGMAPYIDDGDTTKTRPPWVDKPQFSHMIFPSEQEDRHHSAPYHPSSVSGPKIVSSLRDQFGSANSLDDVTKVVKEMISTRVEVMTQTSSASIDFSSPFIELGLDSLDAIEIREFIRKNMDVEIPLLRILSRESIIDICKSIAVTYLQMKKGNRNERIDEIAENKSEGFETRKSFADHTWESSEVAHQLSDDTMDKWDASSLQSLKDSSSNGGESFSGIESVHLVNHQPPSPDSIDTLTSPKFPLSVSSPTVSFLLHTRQQRRYERYEDSECLSQAQAGIHFVRTLLGDPNTFNVTIKYKIHGSLDLHRLRGALERVLHRHEMYRTCFSAGPGGQPKQHIIRRVDLHDKVEYASSQSIGAYSEVDSDTNKAFDMIADTEYDLVNGETFRALVVSNGENLHTAIFGFHVIASDAFSFSIFLRDLDQAYRMQAFPSVPRKYLEFVRKQLDHHRLGKFVDAVKYWRDQLNPPPPTFPVLFLAQTRSRKPRLKYDNNIARLHLSHDLTKKLKTASQACGVTLMQFFLGAMQFMLAQLAEIDDICIGVADNGRGLGGEFNETVGSFANILPMRFELKSKYTVRRLLQNTSSTVLQGFDNGQIPFELLLENLGVERSTLQTPLFQVAFNYRIGDLIEVPLGDCTMSMDRCMDIKIPHDLAIHVTQRGSKGAVDLEIITAAYLYSLPTTEFILRKYLKTIELLAENTSVTLDHDKLLEEYDIRDALNVGEGPRIDYRLPSTLPERFLDVVAEFPDHIAIKDHSRALTYSQFANHVARITSQLAFARISLGSRVAVLCDQSVDLYATMVAVLFSGAVFVPLDTKLPLSRLQRVIDESRPALLVYDATTSNIALQCSSNGKISTLKLSMFNNTDNTTKNCGKLPPLPKGTPEFSFLLFTSGSTGKPKGIKLRQAGIMNYVAAKQFCLGLGQIKVLQQTSIGFDMAIAQAFNAIVNGGVLVIAPSSIRGDPKELAQLMLNETIEFTLATPSEYHMLAKYASETLRKCKSWKFACSGGEVVSKVLRESMRRLDIPELLLFDCYGPTEISCATTFQKINLYNRADDGAKGDYLPQSSSAVGNAIPNTSIYILSKGDSGTVMPVGIPGEICVGGAGVAEGYLDQDLENHKFVPNLWATEFYHDKGWKRMYRTGDKGLLQPDGSLVFLGRMDDADTLVKLRGLRIDLQEVEVAIMKAAPEDFLSAAVVTSRGDPPFLVATVAFVPGKTLDQKQLDSILHQLPLPQYMIPSVIFPVKGLPQTPNGKLDRRAIEMLPLPSHNSVEKKPTQLSVPEGELRLIWLNILDSNTPEASISHDTDFFRAGGSSLLLVRLQTVLEEKTGVRLALSDLYQASTLGRMAALMSQERGWIGPESSINWDTETALPSEIEELSTMSPALPRPKKDGRQVLLVGAHTFLGGEILRQLFSDTSIMKIHCISVPDYERKGILSDEAASSKIIVYSGNSMDSSLGLLEQERVYLQSNVDQIIDAMMQGHCMNNYFTVRQSLYYSTQALVHLALPRRIPFHFISAARVLLLSGNFEGKPESMAAHKPPTDGSQGVTASKWASERFLEQVSEQTGLPVTIHRPCALIGERAPADEVFNSVIQYSLLSKKVPSIKKAYGFFDFKDVAEVAFNIVALGNGSRAEEAEDGNSSNVKYIHHSSNIRVPFTKIAERMGTLYGERFEEVEPQEWLAAASNDGMPEMLVIHLMASFTSGTPTMFPYLGSIENKADE